MHTINVHQGAKYLWYTPSHVATNTDPEHPNSHKDPEHPNSHGPAREGLLNEPTSACPPHVHDLPTF